MKQRLLTLEEAAQYLNVSKVSLRRWTNDGSLSCVRIGPRRERRFRPEDLISFTREPRAGKGANARSAHASAQHVSLYFRTLDEHWDLFRPYLVDHLERGLPVIYIHDDDRGDNILRRLHGEGVDVALSVDAGLLRIIPATKAYLRTGSFNAQRMLDFMESAILDMRSAGHSGGMLTGETNWYMSGARGVTEFIAYEERLNDLLEGYPQITTVCHYDVRRMDGEVVLHSLRSHGVHSSRIH